MSRFRVEDDILDVTGVGAIKPPSGTTANRPAIAEEGMIRHNSSVGAIEQYLNGRWSTLGGSNWKFPAQTGPITMEAGNGYMLDTSGGSYTVFCPPLPNEGDEIFIADFANTYDVNAITIDGNGNDINYATNPSLTISDRGFIFSIVWNGSFWAIRTINMEPTSFTVAGPSVLAFITNSATTVGVTAIGVGAIPVSSTIAGALASINNGAPVALPASVNAGDIVQLVMSDANIIALPDGDASQSGEFTVGTNTRQVDFVVDKEPSPFAGLNVFTTNSNVGLGGTHESTTTVTVSGVNALTPVYVTGGISGASYAIQRGGVGAFEAWRTEGSAAAAKTTGALAMARDGDVIKLRHTVSLVPNTTQTTTLHVGWTTQTATWTTVTANIVSFPTPINVPATSHATSTTTWSNGAMSIESDGCMEISLDGITFGNGPLTIVNTDTLYTRWNSGVGCINSAHGTTINGGIFSTASAYRDDYTFTIDKLADAFSFNDPTGVALSSINTSNVITLAGLNTRVKVWGVLGVGATNKLISINGSAFQTLPDDEATGIDINNGDTIQVRLTVGNTSTTSYDLTVHVGLDGTEQTDVFTATTTAAIPSVQQPVILTPTNDATGISNNPTITSSSYTPLNSAGAHDTTEWQFRDGLNQLTSTNNITAVNTITPVGNIRGTDPGTIEVQDMIFVDPDNGTIYVGGAADRTIFVSTDGGATFVERNPLGSGNQTSGIFKMNDGYVYTFEAGGYYRSNDNGATWSFTSSAGYVINPLSSVGAFYSESQDRVLLLSSSGAMQRSITSGDLTSWSTVVAAPEARFGTYDSVSDTAVIVGLSDSNIRFSTDFGTTWTQSNALGTGDDAPGQIIRSSSGRWFCASIVGLYWSDDLINWTYQDSGLSNPGTASNDFNARRWIYEANGVIVAPCCYTTDNGATIVPSVHPLQTLFLGKVRQVKYDPISDITIAVGGLGGDDRIYVYDGTGIPSTELTISGCQTDGFKAGDSITELGGGGDASGAIASLDNTKITLSSSNGVWTVGSKVDRAATGSVSTFNGVSATSSTNAITSIGTGIQAASNTSGSVYTELGGISVDETTGVWLTTSGKVSTPNDIWKSVNDGATWNSVVKSSLGNNTSIVPNIVKTIASNGSGLWMIGNSSNGGTASTQNAFIKNDSTFSNFVDMKSSLMSLPDISGFAHVDTGNVIHVTGQIWLVAGGAGNTTTSERSYLARTTDDGVTWSMVEYDTVISDAAVGFSMLIEGGLNYRNHCIDSVTGHLYLVGRPNASTRTVYKSTNNGATWSAAGSIPLSNTTGQLTWAFHNNIGIVQNSADTIFYRSTNGGTTWVNTTSNVLIGCRSLKVIDGKFVADDATNSDVFVSNDSGITWDIQTSPINAEGTVAKNETSGNIIWISYNGSGVGTTGSVGAVTELSISGADADGFAIGQSITEIGNGNNGTGVIVSIDGTTVALTNETGTWDVGSQLQRASSNLTSLSPATLASGKWYSVRVKYTSVDPVSSSYSEWSEFKTA